MKKPSLLIIFLTVFIDLIGFGIVLPLLPIFAANFEANGFAMGAIMASYSIMQFLFAPLLGRISDRKGRRPILLLSLAGSTISYVIFAIGSGMTGKTAILLLFASRIFAGICGANITVAQAYIADITAPEERSKKMGLIGMAFGLGFIFGPILSGIGLHFSGVTAPGWIAAALCGLNFIFAFARLPESWKPSSEHVTQRPHLEQFLHTIRLPKIGLLISLFFLATFIFSAFEMTIGLLVSKQFNLVYKDIHGVPVFDPKITYIYAYCALVGALVQGGAVGRAVKKYGEARLIFLSFFLVTISVVPIPYISPSNFGWTGLLVLLAVLSIGANIVRPPIFGMLSNLTSSTEQGATIGVAQSAGSLARIPSPIFAAMLFYYQPALPYLICAGISAIACILAWRFLKSEPKEVTRPV